MRIAVCRAASYACFLSSFGDARKPAASTEALSLDALASRLEMRTRAAKFPRMAERSATLNGVRAAARERERLFSDSFGTDTPALRDAALSFERLDARLVGLCVEQVLHAFGARTKAR